jgi:hypothetical protein
MKISKALIGLSILIALLAGLAAAAGIFWNGDGQAVPFTTAHGETVELYGRGLYRYDSSLIAVGYVNQDKVVLAMGLPLLLISAFLYARGSLRGGLVLTGTLAYFLYDYLSMAFGAAYNAVFPLYIGLFSACVFGLILSFTSFDLAAFPARFSERLPRRGIVGYLFFVGVAFFIIWGGLDLLPNMLAGKIPPTLMHYTTGVTYILDLGIIGPAMLAAGWLLLRRQPIGYLLASMLLIFSVPINLQLAVMGVMQYLQGLMSLGQFIAFTISFNLLGLIALLLTVALFRSMNPSQSPQTGQALAA